MRFYERWWQKLSTSWSRRTSASPAQSDFLLRATNINRWTEAQFDWLPEGDIPADPVCDFRTAGNRASVWKIGNPQADQRLLLERRIAVAIAARRDRVASFDYILLDSAAVDAAGIKVCRKDGESADPELNGSLHPNLEKISAGKLAKLVNTTLREPRLERLYPKDIAIEIWDRICKKHLDKSRIKSGLLTSAAEHILKGLAATKIDLATIEREVIEAAAKHYLGEHNKRQLPRKCTKDACAKEAEKWVSSQCDS